ncbi:Abi family protein [Cohnella pontilimi]|uniref:Abi family protein n=1 Tax=Cohnella pontilimi TaxID=2564100 RepID=UPI001B80C174
MAGTFYGVPDFYLQSWLRALTLVRNICAHYSRFYNKRLTVTPKLYSDDNARIDNSRVFASILVSGILCPSSSDWSSFVIALEALIDEYAAVIELGRIGFPLDWRNLLRDTVITRRFSSAAYRLRINQQNKPQK